MLCVTFAPGGKRLASGGADGATKLWEPASGRLLASLMILPSDKEEEASNNWIAFTPDGYYLGSSDAKRFIRWRVRDVLSPAEQHEKNFQRPDLVQKSLSAGS